MGWLTVGCVCADHCINFIVMWGVSCPLQEGRGKRNGKQNKNGTGEWRERKKNGRKKNKKNKKRKNNKKISIPVGEADADAKGC